MRTKIEKVDSYERLIRWRDMFLADDGIELIVVGPPGRGKSRIFTDALGRPDIDYTLFKGHALAFEMYRRLFGNRDLPVLIDDVNDALRERDKRALLMALTENEQSKTICWASSSNRLVTEEGEPIPTRFETRSRVCILCNDLGSMNKYLAPLLSRSFVVEFMPTKTETHRYAESWFEDGEICEFVGQHLELIVDLDLRDYGQAQKLKRHGEDWRQMLLNRWMNDSKQSAVLQIILDPHLTTFEQRAQRFMEQTGASRRTFAYQLKELKRLGVIPGQQSPAPLHRAEPAPCIVAPNNQQQVLVDENYRCYPLVGESSEADGNGTIASDHTHCLPDSPSPAFGTQNG